MKGSEWRDDQVAPFGESSGSGGELAPPRLVLFSGDLAASVALAQDDECTIPVRASVCEPPDSGDDRSDQDDPADHHKHHHSGHVHHVTCLRPTSSVAARSFCYQLHRLVAVNGPAIAVVSAANTSLRAALQGALRKQAAEDPLTEFERLPRGGSGTQGGRVGVATRSWMVFRPQEIDCRSE